MTRCCAYAIIFVAVVRLVCDAQEAEQRKIDFANQGKKLAIEAGLLEGICRVELIRPDLLSVTLDGGVVGQVKETPESDAIAEALGGHSSDLRKPGAFTINSDDDQAYSSATSPSAVGRASYESYNCMDVKNRWPLCANTIWRHDYFLRLPYPLRQGSTYVITVHKKDPDPRFEHTIQFAYDRTTTTKVIKVNQCGYSSVAKRRFAYLGWWAGSFGPVEYDDFQKFGVIDVESGKQVYGGDITLRATADRVTGENIHEMDISALGPGSYQIEIPGLARSDPFHVGGPAVFETFYHTARAFFHQRCGQEFREPWTAFVKPACHAEIWESGEFVAGPGAIHHFPGRRDEHNHYEPQPGEKKIAMKGGYHDAADFDTFSYHIPATVQMLTAYEMAPEVFTDGQLNIPESGNGIPDLLDEADWGLSWHLAHQYDTGSIPLGRINHCDGRKQNIEGDNAAPMPPYGIIPPRRNSTPVFAAAAAQLARNLRSFDEQRASEYLDAAIKAFNYCSSHTAVEEWEEHSTKIPIFHPDRVRDKIEPGRSLRGWISDTCNAAAELLLTIGDQRYNDYILANEKYMPLSWAYMRCDPSRVDVELQQRLQSRLLTGHPMSADAKKESAEEGCYRQSNANRGTCGWGAGQAINHCEVLLKAFWLTGDQTYLDAACFNADWHQGVNPISQTFLTAMGHRYPNRPEISWFLYENTEVDDIRGPTVRGISIYGFGPPVGGYPSTPDNKIWPVWRSWRDVWNNFAEIYSEFTVPQTMGPAVMTYATLYAMERKAGTIQPNVSSRFPLGARDR